MENIWCRLAALAFDKLLATSPDHSALSNTNQRHLFAFYRNATACVPVSPYPT